MTPNTRIAYTQEDGTVAIVTPAPEFIAQGGTVEQLARKSIPLGTHFEEMDVADVPKDRYFRNAWRLGAPLSKSIEIDRPKAEAIHMNKLREIRDEKLKAEDIEYQKAIEFRDDAKMNAIANRKKKLRDMPLDVDFSGMSLDELKAYIPEILR